jgi:hypothetical protein
MWDIVESPCQDEWEQESGEVVYNKRQNWKYTTQTGTRLIVVH